MLVRPHELLAGAFEGRYCVGAFNVSNLELTQAVVRAGEEQDSPVIVQTSEGAIKYAGLGPLAATVKAVAAEVKVPVVLHLDHGKNLAMVKQCIAAGYTSVMIDESKKSLAENITLVKEVVEYAHKRGVWVEAELGTIFGAEGATKLKGGQTPVSVLTDPEQTAQFVEETGVDSLAVAVGTIHGAFTGQEYVRFELLEEIEKVVPALPLVVHGASGISGDHLKAVAATNVCKVNVDTELRLAFEAVVKGYFDEEHDKADPREIIGPAREAVQVVVQDKIRIFGSAGRA